MKKKFLKNILIIFFIVIYYIESNYLLKKFNSSTQTAFKILFYIFIIIIFLSAILCKFIFKYRIQKKLDLNNFKKNDLYKSILLSTTILLTIFSIIYIVIFFFGYTLYFKLIKTTGIINSLLYLSKIFLATLPIYAFEITFFEYCNFLNSTIYQILIISIKSLLLIITTIILTNIFSINGFLYSKIIIDIIFFPYYVFNLKNIIKLCY